MPNAIEQALATAGTGPCIVGQVAIRPRPRGGFVLSHRDDEPQAETRVFSDPDDALVIAKYDDSGKYRPLKTAPNLPAGWRLELETPADLQRALDGFYPGRLAAFRAWRAGQLRTTTLRETLDRQTGMYRVAATISDQQIDRVTSNFCRSDGGCLRTILWKRDVAGALPSKNLPPQKFDPAHDQAAEREVDGAVSHSAALPGSLQSSGGCVSQSREGKRWRGELPRARERRGGADEAATASLDAASPTAGFGVDTDALQFVLSPAPLQRFNTRICGVDHRPLNSALKQMIVRARAVLTMNGPPIANGAVAISGNRILDVGTFPEVRAQISGEVIDLGEQVLLPGLINAHCHLDYTCLRGKIPGPQSFTGWIESINAQKQKLSPADYLRSINDGFAEAKRLGTTAIANLTGFPDLAATIKPPIRAWWFAELIDVRDPARAGQLADAAAESLKALEHWGLAPHAPFTASASLYRRCQEIAPLLTTHLAESREEMAMFRDGSGSLYDFLKEIGRDMSDCGGKTPLANFLAQLGDRSPPWMVAHMNELAETDFDLLQSCPARFAIVHCPRSHEYFGHSPFEFEKLQRLGFNICIGTDSLASNEDLGLLAELRAFQRNHSAVSAHEILELATTNAARALGQQERLGKIAPGFFADLIAVPCEGKARAMRFPTGD